MPQEESPTRRAPPRRGDAPGQQDLAIPANWRETYPFSARFPDTAGARHVIDLAAVRFATDRLVALAGGKTFREPDLPPALSSRVRQAFSTGGRELFIVQATDARTQVALRGLLERARVPILGYIPNDAYLVRLDQRGASLVGGARDVFWMGLYQPAYRVAPVLDFISDAHPGYRLKLLLRMDPESYASEAALREALGAVPDAEVVEVTRGRRDWIVRVDGPVTLARTFTELPGCLWVERFTEVRLHNDVARTSAEVPTGRGTSPGPIMDVEDVWARGIRGEGQVAAAADTGLSTGDVDSADSLHWDFGQKDSPTNPMRVTGYAVNNRGTWDDDPSIGGGHGTHVSGSIVGNGVRSGAVPWRSSFPPGSFAGIAPKAGFLFQSIMYTGGTPGNPVLGAPFDLNELFITPYDRGARVHSNSWGTSWSQAGEYTTGSQTLDEFVWNHKDMVVTFSAGNSGNDEYSRDGVVDPMSIGAPGTAKNCITVGASENYRPEFVYEVVENWCESGLDYTWYFFDQDKWQGNPIHTDLMADNANGLAPFSSRGPTWDGRFKPDITAAGAAVVSTRTNEAPAYEPWGICDVPADQRTHYVTMGGTSMSNPLTAGAATLVRQYYVDGWHANGSDVTNPAPVPAQGFDPSAALVKATLVNGAWDMAPGQYGTFDPEIPPKWDRDAGVNLPNNAEGYGRVDLEASLFPHAGWGRSSSRSVHVRDVAPGIGTSGRDHFSYGVFSSTDPLIVTLVWTDPPPLMAAATALVNDLDLEVTSPSGRRYTPNRVDDYVTDPQDFRRDSLNNVEQVKVTAPESGTWTIDVFGKTVPGNGGEGTTTQPFAVVVSTVACAMPDAPKIVVASPSGNNSIDVQWAPVAGVSTYRVYRGRAAGQATTLLATVTGTSFSDTTAEGGVTYYYVVKSLNLPACEAASEEVSTVTTGACSLGPDFAGLASVASSGSGACGLTLGWPAAAAPCGGTVRYSVFRSTDHGFAPGLGNRIAAGLGTTSFSDSGDLTSGATYYYAVRATDEGNGVEETNTVERSGSPAGALTSQILYGPEGFEGVADGSMGNWTTRVFGGDADDWRGVQTCSGNKVLRYGGTTCTGNYAEAFKYSFAGPPAIAIPPGSTNVRLSFSHRWNFEKNYDGALLRIALNGTNHVVVPASAILAGPYNGINYTWQGVSDVWDGDHSSSSVDTVVDLDAACNAVPGHTGGCAGNTIVIAFAAVSNYITSYPGWFIDDVQVTADAPVSCDAAPQTVGFLTARSTSNTNLLEWRNPTSGGYGSAVVRYRTDGVFPTTPSEGAGVTCDGQDPALGAYNSCTHSGLVNGTTCSYSLFVDNGSGVYSARRSVAATPIDTSEAHKWAYATGAANLAPAGILPGVMGAGGVFVLSNDRALHGLEPTAAGGSWLRSASFDWAPASMNAPAQHRPPVVPLAAGPRVFLASQDGYAYAVNARTGAVVWTSAKLGDVLQANPAGLFSDLKPTAPNLLFVGSRNATSANTLYALDPATGAVVTQFNNGGGAGAIGIVTGIAVDYATNHVYFTSRASGTGSSGTLWSLDAGGGTLVKAWALPLSLGDIDGSPVLYQGRVYVGTNAGEVKAIDPSGPTVVWTYTCSPADGPVKGYVFPHSGSSPLRLYFATTNSVWAIVDNGGTAGPGWSVATVANPSTPLHVIGTNHLLVGSSNGTLYELSTVDGSQEGSVSLGSSALGSPARDSVNGLCHVGSTAGVLHAVTLPVP